ncbi:hypothetical protein [Patulibacter sp.]|uniref:hypothetical protein n=1 Tax=Patulibacter sp. TaxID=1912859 RepID=UPI00271852BA|nr:hypothetical protein [Patulibacter sp.]MDO9409825.1 hypothetical protein [Patulibacter sp.]
MKKTPTASTTADAAVIAIRHDPAAVDAPDGRSSATTEPSSTTRPAPADAAEWTPTAVVALVGYRANPNLPFGGVRTMTVDEGVVRILDRDGATVVEVPAEGMTIRKTRMGNVLLRWDGGSASINPTTNQAIIGKGTRATFLQELESRAADRDVTAIGPSQEHFSSASLNLKPMKSLAAIRRAIMEGLEEHGATWEVRGA